MNRYERWWMVGLLAVVISVLSIGQLRAETITLTPDISSDDAACDVALFKHKSDWVTPYVVLSGKFLSDNDVGGFVGREYGYYQRLFFRFDLSSLEGAGYTTTINSVTLKARAAVAYGDAFTDGLYPVTDDAWTGGPTAVWEPSHYYSTPGTTLLDSWEWPGNNERFTRTTSNLAAFVANEFAGDKIVSFCIQPVDFSEAFPDWTSQGYYADEFGLVVDCTRTPIPGYATEIPVITPDGGSFSEPQTVTITCATPDATIRYTLDGSDPTESSEVYSGPFTVDRIMSVKAKAWSSTKPPSFIKTAMFDFPVQAATPQADLTIDGDLSDWPTGVWSAPFVFWNGTCLTSTTKARFAWNDTQDVLYVAVTTDECSQQSGGHLVVGVSKNINSVPLDSLDSTQLCFDYNTSEPKNVLIRNEIALYGLSGAATGVEAACSQDGSTYTYEIAIPLWSNWSAGTDLQNLAAGNTVYTYVIMEDKFSGANGTNLTYYGNPNFAGSGFAEAAALTLQAQTAIPGDANNDGKVDVGDLGILAGNLGILAGNYGRDLQTEGVPAEQWWGLGDFNGDGVVDVGDLGILAGNYGTGASGANWDADYAKAFGTTMKDDAETDSPICGALGLPLIAGLMLAGLMLLGSSKLED